MIHTTGHVGRRSLCHRHVLDNGELALGPLETITERLSYDPVSTQKGFTSHKGFNSRDERSVRTSLLDSMCDPIREGLSSASVMRWESFEEKTTVSVFSWSSSCISSDS